MERGQWHSQKYIKEVDTRKTTVRSKSEYIYECGNKILTTRRAHSLIIPLATPLAHRHLLTDVTGASTPQVRASHVIAE